MTTTTYREFVPTHRLTRGVRLAPIVDEVMLDADAVGDGPAYTHAEFANYDTARFSLQNGEWHLDNVRCTGLRVEALTDQTTPETVASIALPASPEWLDHNEYPDTARLRVDGSVVVRGLRGARAYRYLSHFCRAWKVLVSFAVTRPMSYWGSHDRSVAVPDELIVRYTGETTALFPGTDQPDRSFPSLYAACRTLDVVPERLYRGTVTAHDDMMGFARPLGPVVEYAHNLWTLNQLQSEPAPVTPTVRVAPDRVTPLRGAIDSAKVAHLTRSMAYRGWSGPPLLAEPMPHGSYVAWTGRHRLLAARSARLSWVPLLLVDVARWAQVHGSPCPYGAVYDTRDDIHRAMSLAMAGDLTAASLMAHEISGARHAR